jgi:hypothetical protein
MSRTWMHCIWVLLLGYLIGYYFPQLAKATAGKLYPAKSSNV